MPAFLRTLRGRITIASTAVLVVVLALAAMLIVVLVERQLRDELDEQNQATIQRISDEIAQGIDPALISLPLASDGTEFSISTATGDYVNATVFTFFGADGEELPFDDEALLEDLSAEDFFLNDEIDALFAESFWDITSSTATDPSGAVFQIDALSPVAVVERSVDQVRSVLWLVIPALAALFAGLVWFVTGRALRPVDEITARAGQISVDTLHQRVDEPDTNDEVQRLAVTLNSMLERLERGATAQKQFVSDASHELQTPLTVMLGEAQLAAGTNDPERLTQANERVIAQGEHMRSLIEDLLHLARAGEAGLHYGDVDLDDVIRQAAAMQPGPVDTRNVVPTRISGDAASLARAFRNLLDNATRYGNGAISVTTHVDETTNQVVVHVDDDGAGIPAAQRLDVFERFVRLDASRNRATGGTGLGLAITKAIIHAHQGMIGVGESPLGGARFEVRLPS